MDNSLRSILLAYQSIKYCKTKTYSLVQGNELVNTLATWKFHQTSKIILRLFKAYEVLQIIFICWICFFSFNWKKLANNNKKYMNNSRHIN